MHSDFCIPGYPYNNLSSSSVVSSGPQVDVVLHSAFASRKRGPAEEERSAQTAMYPSNFQVYAKIDEESRKDNHLVVSFLLTLNDAKGSVTYEFRGICNITGSSVDFESVMEANKHSRVPKILDIIYHKLYPAIFMLAGMTVSSYPQSIAVLTEMVSSEPIPVKQEISTTAQAEEKKLEEPKAIEKKEVPAPKVTAKPKPQPAASPDNSNKVAAAK